MAHTSKSRGPLWPQKSEIVEPSPLRVPSPPQKSMFCQQTPTENINIAILGCVSAGKSTILNAMFCQDLSQCKIKRTTMMPTAFVETQNKHETMSPDEINEAISSVNK